MRILLLNQTFHPDVASTAQHSSDLAAELVRRGHDVTVVCSQRAYDNPGQRYPKREVWRGVRIRRISCSAFGKKARWRRAADFGSYLTNCVVHLARLPRFDLVVALTSPPLISWLGAVFARVKGGRFVFWVMDLNPDEALAAGWLRPSSWTTKRLEGMLRYSLDRATTVVALDHFMEKRIADKGVDPSKLVVVPPWSHDLDVGYDARGRERFRKTHGLLDRYVVMYSGNHSPCHPLTTLLEAGLRLRERRDIAFCFVGGGSEFQTVRTFAADHSLDNILTIPYQPLSELSASLSSADLHVVVMGDAYVGIVHPCKVYNIRAIGIPYLYIGPSQSHVQELGPTYSARHGDVDAVVRHIEAAAVSDPNRPADLCEVTDYGRERLISRMVTVLENAGSPSVPDRSNVEAVQDSGVAEAASAMADPGRGQPSLAAKTLVRGQAQRAGPALQPVRVADSAATHR